MIAASAAAGLILPVAAIGVVVLLAVTAKALLYLWI